jgi:polysaccharide lyase-like protein
MNWRRSLMMVAVAAVTACDQQIDVGSDLLWTARFESGNFDEWTSVEGGSTLTSPASNDLAISTDRARRGAFAARMTTATSSEPVSSLSTLNREGDLPDEAYYSAWYFLPQSASVPNAPILQYWAIMRFRGRTVAGDPGSAADLFDVDLRNRDSGGMTLRIFDYDSFADATMIQTDPVVPVGRWFQVEAFHRMAPDATGRLSLWLDGELVADIRKATGSHAGAGWRVGNMALGLDATPVTVYVDDCAISHVRVGPSGLLTR